MERIALGRIIVGGQGFRRVVNKGERYDFNETELVDLESQKLVKPTPEQESAAVISQEPLVDAKADEAIADTSAVVGRSRRVSSSE